MVSESSGQVLGIVGGTGLYDLPGMTGRSEDRISTPFGDPTDVVVSGQIGSTRVVFISRHGRGHRYSPTNLPYRANVYALKAAGCTHVLSVSAVGSLREDIAPRDMVIPDQIIDRTVQRPRTFFDDGAVAHVGIAHPFDANFRRAVIHAAGGTGSIVHDGGTYVCIEGPQFSTLAESRLYRSWQASVIGMTAMPEARLVREAEMAYATMAMVTDYDVWHETEAHVSIEVVSGNLAANAEFARVSISRLIGNGLPPVEEAVANALSGAISTDRSAISPETVARLGVIGQRYLS